MKQILIKIFLILRTILFSIFLRKKRKMPLVIRKILLIRFDRLGDLVLSTSIFPALREIYPHAEIHIAISPALKNVLTGNQHIDRVIYPENTSWKNLWKFTDFLKHEKYDLCIDLALSRSAKSSLTASFSGAKYLIGFDSYGKSSLFDSPVKDPGFDIHFTEAIYHLLKPLDYNNNIYAPELEFYPGELNKKTKFIKKNELLKKDYIVIHPGAFYPSQRFPHDKIAKIINRLSREENFIICGSPADSDEINELKKMNLEKSCKFITTKSIRELMYLISESKLYFGNNSGPLHLAGALKIKTVSTLGPTRPYFFSPFGNNNEVINLKLPCAPCDLAVCSHHSCLKNITPEQVITAIKKLLKN